MSFLLRGPSARDFCGVQLHKRTFLECKTGKKINGKRIW